MLKPYLYKNFLHNFKFLLGIHRKRAYIGPHTVILDIEDECNLKCEMCFYHSPYIEERFKKEFRRLDYQWIEKLINDLRKIETRKISLCGKGEPFLHPDILKILILIKSKKFYLNIFTNGIHLTPKILNKLLELKIDQITLSLHAADEDTYLRVHPQAKAYFLRNIIQLLKILKEYKGKRRSKLPYVKIINVIYKKNYQNVNKMLELACSYADEILFKPVLLYKEQAQLKLNQNEIKELIEKLRAKRAVVKIANNIETYLNWLSSQINPKLENNFQNPSRCFIPFYQSTIGTEGNVYLCPYNQSMVLGNIKKESFPSIWFSQRFNNLRNELNCKNCKAVAVYPYLEKYMKFFKG